MSVIYYALGALISLPLMSGTVYTNFQWGHGFASIRFHREECQYAARARRSDAGQAILLGCMAAPLWPVMLIIIYLLTGFAEHGIWRSYGD